MEVTAVLKGRYFLVVLIIFPFRTSSYSKASNSKVKEYFTPIN